MKVHPAIWIVTGLAAAGGIALFAARPKSAQAEPNIGAFTELHWDNHVDGVWQWHRGVSILTKAEV